MNLQVFNYFHLKLANGFKLCKKEMPSNKWTHLLHFIQINTPSDLPGATALAGAPVS